MCVELKLRGHEVKREVDVVVRYKNEIIGNDLRIDLLVDDFVIVELKSVSQIHPRMQAQLLSYLRLTNLRLGYIINFNEVRLTNGLQRFMNNQQKAA
jgi:GxxExxY protein